MTAPANDNFTTDYGDNGGPKIIDPTEAFQKIDDLYSEARNFADGEPITSAEMAEAITALYDGLHEAGKEAEALRVAEKAPLDLQVEAVQSKYNPYVQPKKGKVSRGKDALGVLLTAWRVQVQKAAAERAAAAAALAAELKAKAEADMQASNGNLEARELAEEAVDMAKEATRFAKRTEKAATVGTGLRTVWTAELVDDAAALDWAFGRAQERFLALAQQLADEAVRANVREIPGFSVIEGKVAA